MSLTAAARRRPITSDPRPFPVAASATWLKGANVAVRNGDVTNGNDSAKWGGLWGSSDGGGWVLSDITDQIDHAKAMGCNYVRLVGDIQKRVAGTLTQANYAAHIAAALDYCRAQSVFVHWCIVSSQDLRDERVALPSRPIIPTSDILTCVRADCAVLSSNYSDIVFAVDYLQEISSMEVGYEGGACVQSAISRSDVIALAQAMYAALRAGLPRRIRIAVGGLQEYFDDASNIVSQWTLREALGGAWEYIDLHVYASSFTSGNVDTIQALYPSHALLIGEWGAPLDGSRGMSPSTAHDMLVHNYTKAAGIWALRDWQNTDNSDRWGTHDNSGVIRQKGIDYRDLIPATR